ADVLGQPRRDAAEVAGQERGEPVALCVLAHLEQHPELDAVGVRLDLTGRRRKLVVGPRMRLRLAFRRVIRQLDVRVGDDGLLDVLVDGGAPLLVAPSTSMVTWVPRVESHSICFFSRISGSFFLVSIWTSKKCAGVRALVREMIWTGLPVVSWPYMPAAEMPMPCWPRLIRSRWNLEPERSLAKIGGGG